MGEPTENPYPLKGFTMNICGVKCFDDAGSGFFKFSPITFIIGKNNSGKSTVMDVLQECARKSNRMFEGPMVRLGHTPQIQIRMRPSVEKLKGVFPSNVSGGQIPGASHWDYANRYIAPFSFIWSFDQNKNVKVIISSEEKGERGINQNAVNMLSRCSDFPFDKLWSIRIRAERDVVPEGRKTERLLYSDGRGLTNLIRAFIHSDDLPRSAVEIDLLNDLNEIYLGDSVFTEILCQENDESEEWEIFLREDEKGDIRLSQSGSSLRTVFLILAFLRLFPAVNKTGPADKMIFCLEEPENNLHPALLRRLIDFLARQREERFFSLVITTHSPVCIDLATKRKDATILHVRAMDGRTTCENVLDYHGRSSILEDLDVRGSDILQANGVIWVEGPSDRIYINKWIEIFSDGKLREGVHYTIMFYGGKILSHFEALPPSELPKKIAMLSLNRNISIVIDSDRRPKNWRSKTGKRRKPQTNLNSTKREIIRQVNERGGFVWVTSGKEIENYVPQKVWNKVAGTDLKILDEYEDIPAIANLKKISPTKVELAHRVEQLIDRDALSGHLDLEVCLGKLCEQIRNWNGLNGSAR